MPSLSNFGLSRSNSARTVESQSTVVASAPVNVKLPYWAPTAEEVEAARLAAPKRSFSQRMGLKSVAASKATPTPTPAQATPPKPVPSPTVPARKFSYEPVAGNPYADADQVDPATRYWQNEAAAARARKSTRSSAASHKRSSSPPYVPREGQNFDQPRSLSPGSIFANGGTPPAPSATRKASLTISRGIGSLRKASSNAKKALTPKPQPKISGPVAGSFQREFAGELEPLNLVGLDIAQADASRYAQPDFQIAAAQKAAERARVASARRDSHTRLTGESTPVASPQVASPSAPSGPNSSPAATKKAAPRKVVNSTFGGVIEAGKDSSWVPNPRAGLDRPPPPPPEQNIAWPWSKGKGKGKVSTPEASTVAPPPPTNNPPADLNPFAALAPAAQMFKKQGQANQETLPTTPVTTATLAQPAAPLAPEPLAPRRPLDTRCMPGSSMTATQWAAQAPRVPGTDFTVGIYDRRVSDMLRIKCTGCNKVIFAAAIPGHRCAKPKMTAEEKANSNPKFEDFFQPKFTKVQQSEEAEKPEVFLDTYVGAAAQSVWRSVTRQ